MAKMRVKVLAFDKPDATGCVYRGPVDLSAVDPTLKVCFDYAPVGRLLETEQDEDGVYATYEVRDEMSDLVPVACLSMPGKQVSPFRDVKLVKLGMVGMDEAILPPGFVWERLDGCN